jgi:beta-lactamase regulating signal transducer with metallopeptidase domain
MENTLYNIGQVLGITIIHSLWQGLFIYFVLRAALLFGSSLSASKKYLLAITSMLAMAGWFVCTLINQIQLYNWLATASVKLPAILVVADFPAGITELNNQSIRYYYSIEHYLPYITIIYVIGLLFNTARLMLGRRKINIIKQTMSIDLRLQTQVNKFIDMLNIDHRVKIGLSKLIDVPCMVGYFKPIILLPFTLQTYLAPEEIEAIILHELAHIKRNDYLVNLLQQVIAALLFFNPCALLINRIINEERENCCDDFVVESAPNPVVYAKALLKLEQTRENNMRMAISAAGKKYQLLSRIERIMKTKKTTTSLRPALLAMLLLILSIGSIALFNPKIAQGKISLNRLANHIIKSVVADTAHKQVIKPQFGKNNKKHEIKSKRNNKIDIGDQYYGGFEDAKLEKLYTEISKYNKDVESYYNNPEFKKQTELIEAKSKLIEDFYSRPDVQKMLTEQKKLSEAVKDNWSENPEIKQLTDQINESGNKLSKYYKSPGFEKMKKEFEKKYGLPSGQLYNTRDTSLGSAKFKSFIKEVYKNLPEDIKEQTKIITDLSKSLNKRYDTLFIRPFNEKLRIVADSLRTLFDAAKIRQQQIDIGRLSAQISSYQTNETIRKKQMLLQQLNKQLVEYTNASDFKKNMQQWKKSINEMKRDMQARPEKAEKPEKPEAPEKPETKSS